MIPYIEKMPTRKINEYGSHQPIYYRRTNSKDAPWFAGEIVEVLEGENPSAKVRLITKGPLARQEVLPSDLAETFTVENAELLRPRENT